jgi:hypothetical protein
MPNAIYHVIIPEEVASTLCDHSTGHDWHQELDARSNFITLNSLVFPFYCVFLAIEVRTCYSAIDQGCIGVEAVLEQRHLQRPKYYL